MKISPATLKGWLNLSYPYQVDAQFCTNRLFYLALHIWIARSEQDRLTHVYQKWVQTLYGDKFILLQFPEISFKFLTSYGRNTKCLRKYCRNTEILMLRNFLSPLCLTLMMVKLSSFRLMILLKIISILWIPTPTLKFSVQNIMDFVYGNINLQMLMMPFVYKVEQ